MPPESTAAAEVPRPSPRTARLGLVALAAIVLLAVVETAQALVAPSRAPTDRDWRAAAGDVRADFRPGDLLVAAPAWADPLLRMHLGDLIPIPTAARMDDARYRRVWEVSQRGARADEARGTVTRQRRFGALTVRLIERPPVEVTYDFLERWPEAVVTRWNPATATAAACPWQGDRSVCTDGGGGGHVELVEVDTRIRRAILAPPVARAITAIEFRAVPLGRELAVAAGLHDVWARKYATGTVYFEVWIDGRRVLGESVGNRSGWRELRVDTSARAGQVVPVRFQISSARPELRHFAFAAEARR